MAALLLFSCTSALAQIPTLDDFWAGSAIFQLDRTGVGSNVGLVFPSMLFEGANIYAYYIKTYTADGETKYATARARSTDGINWTDEGIVVDRGGAWQWTYQAASLSHQVGRLDLDGWSATPALDNAAYLCFGPYTTAIPGGPNCALFKLMIDQHTGTNDLVATLDVYDADTNAVLGTKSVRRNDFTANMTYQTFTVNFTSPAGNHLEFRTYWQDVAYIREEALGISQGSYPFWDGTMSSFPGVWKDNGTYYVVYEGSGNTNGDIGLATSTDGLHFTKSASNPILRHNTSGWERANIGTPSLFKENSTWYLFYHGFDFTDCRIAVATGSTLTSLTKYSGNPIINTVSNTWEAGTCGRRSAINKIGANYYLAYEGSTDQPYGSAKWSSGLARSTDLFHWTKYAGNPAIPQTVSGFGNDGPEMVSIGGVTYLYVRKAPCDRYKLVFTANQLPTITQQPADQTTCPALGVSFTVAASSPSILSYQWQKNNFNLANGGHYSGVTNATLQISNTDINDVADYRCAITNIGGTVQSDSASLTVWAATLITQQPTPQSAAAGGTVTFSVMATGQGTLTYQWQKDSVNLVNGGHISGANSSTLTISSIDSADYAVYRCVVTASCGAVVSNSVLLTVPSIPGDFDSDRDVDMSDFAHFQLCLTGAGTPISDPSCLNADLTGNSTVDAADLFLFLQCFSGPDNPASSDCAQ